MRPLLTAPRLAAGAAVGAQELRLGEARHALLPGMQLTAEIKLAERTVLEYVLSPVQKVVHEAGRER